MRHKLPCGDSDSDISSLDLSSVKKTEKINHKPRSHEVARILSDPKLTRDRSWMRLCSENERLEPYKGINMNSGWARERADIDTYFRSLSATVEDRVDITEQFQSFSFARQQKTIAVEKDKSAVLPSGRYGDPEAWPDHPSELDLLYLDSDDGAPFLEKGKRRKAIKFTEKDAEFYKIVACSPPLMLPHPNPSGQIRRVTYEYINDAGDIVRNTEEVKASEWTAHTLRFLAVDALFTKVFQGSQNMGWTREPGSWWAQRKSLFGRDRGRKLLISPKLDGDNISPSYIVKEGRKKYVAGRTTGRKRKLMELEVGKCI
jgi:hypothetical protein